MVTVSGVGGAGPVANGITRAKSAGGLSGGGFSVGGLSSGMDRAAAAGASAAGASGAVQHPSMLLLQEAACETVRDREARRHGSAMLSRLAALQHALLRGAGADDAALDQLAELATSMPEATSPPLAALVAAITLRVRIELARRS